MEELCSLCGEQPVSLICRTDLKKFCENCVDIHLKDEGFGVASHQIATIDVFQVVEEEEFHQHTALKSEIINTLKDKAKQVRDNLESFKEKAVALLHERKDAIIERVHTIVLKQEYKLALQSSRIEGSLAQLEEELQKWVPLRENLPDSQLKPIMKVCESAEDVKNLSFLHITSPVCDVLGESLDQALEINLSSQPKGRSTSLYYFKPRTNKVFEFDAALEEMRTKMLNTSFVFKDFAAWCELPSGEVVYSGGWNNDIYSNEVVIYTPMLSQIQYAPRMHMGRSQHSLTYHDGYVYCFGGATFTDETNCCERWRLGSTSWDVMSSMKTAKSRLSSCSMGNKIYIAGDTEVECYDPATDTFETLPVKLEFGGIPCLISKNDSILIMRNNSLYEYEIESKVSFKVSPINGLEWWSPCTPVWRGSNFYILLNDERAVYRYNFPTKQLKQVERFL